MEGNNINWQHKAVELTAQIVSSHVSCTPIPSEKIPEVIGAVYAALVGLTETMQVSVTIQRPEMSVQMVDLFVPGDHVAPAIPVELSIKPDKIACLVCGEWFRLLRPHLKHAHGLIEKDYRATYGLTKKYPLVAPEYSKFRADFAKEKGLGHK